MLIVCPTCAMTYQIGLAALGADGRNVRCASCKNTWFATLQSAIADPGTQLVPAAAATAAQSPAAQSPAGQVPAAQAPASQAPAIPDASSDNDLTADLPHGFTVEAMAPEEIDGSQTVIDAPPLAPDDGTGDAVSDAPKFEPGTPENIETIASRRIRHAYTDRKEKRTPLQRVLNIPVLIAVLLAIVLGALQWRVALVRQFPQTASLFSMLGMPVNLRGLSFMDVKSRGEFVEGAMVLVVEGTIVNLTTRTLEIPRVRFGLRNDRGQEVYAWTLVPTRTTLGSGDGLAFRTRLAAPPPDGRDVIVRFFSRRDAGLGS